MIEPMEKLPDPPCDVCHKHPENCLCPECPVCGCQGCPGCAPQGADPVPGSGGGDLVSAEDMRDAIYCLEMAIQMHATLGPRLAWLKKARAALEAKPAERSGAMRPPNRNHNPQPRTRERTER